VKSRAISPRVGWSVAGLVGLIALGLLIRESHEEYENSPPGLGGLADVMRCDPMTEKPKITRVTELHGSRTDQEIVLVAVSDDPPPRDSDVVESGYGLRYSYADGSDTQHQRDELRGAGYQYVHYPDEEYGAYNLGVVPTVDIPGYREMVVFRSVTVPEKGDTGYADYWLSICGTVGFTVGADGRLSDARLVENEDAGTYEYGGQLR